MRNMHLCHRHCFQPIYVPVGLCNAFEIKRASPVPVSDFVPNFENNLSIICRSIPTPVSLTRIITN